jgi:16S rRNA (guanine527-N7)-methyltransferase
VKHSPFTEALTAALRDAPFDLPPEAMERFEQHWQLVKQWNARVNLTAILDDAEAARLHYRDSLEPLSLLPTGAVVDLGSGAGYPGIPLAIAAPSRPITLVEPRRKRASFLETAAARLGLANVRVVLGASTAAPDQEYAAAVTRATFSGTTELLDCLRWLAPGGCLIAFRSTPSGLPGARLHHYTIGSEPRLLEIVSKK